MRAGLVLVHVGAMIAACSGAVSEAPLEAPGPGRVRQSDRWITLKVDERSGLIEWVAGPCRNSRYEGEIQNGEPHGDGRLSMPDGRYRWVEGRFVHGRLDGRVRGSWLELRGGVVIAHVKVERDCTARLMFDAPIEIKNLPLTLDGLISRVRFEGAASPSFRADDDESPLLLRGRIEGMYSGRTVYLAVGPDGIHPIAPTACLRGSCTERDPSVELVGDDDEWSVYRGRFVAGFRTGAGEIAQVQRDRVTLLAVDYDNGSSTRPPKIRRPTHQLTTLTLPGDPLLRSRNDGVSLEEIVVGSTTFHWRTSTFDQAARATLGTIMRSQSLVNIPAADPRISFMAMLAVDLAKPPGIRCVADCDDDAIQIEIDEMRRLRGVYSSTKHDDIVEAWLAASRLLVKGKSLRWEADAKGNRFLEGAGVANRPDGPATIVFHDGTRIDTLGFESVTDYLRASPSARTRRARKAALVAAAARARNGTVVVGLRRLLDGAGRSLSQLSTARAAATAATTGADAPAFERGIRATHAAVERAYDAVLDGRGGGEQALAGLSAHDPTADAIALLVRELSDQEQRLRVLVDAYDDFEYRDDVNRLRDIAVTFSSIVGGLPTDPTETAMKSLRTALAPR